MTNLDLTRAFLRSFETRDGTTAGYYADDVVQREHPNRVSRDGATRTAAQLRAALSREPRVTRDERYEVHHAIEHGDTVAVEATWSAVLNVPFDALAAGSTMRAHIGMFLTWRDGKIVSQRNYDCFEPF